MTNITTLERILREKAEDLLEKKGYKKTFYSENIGSMWEKGDITIDITVHSGHHNALIMIEPYIVIRVNGNPRIIKTKEEIKEIFKNL